MNNFDDLFEAQAEDAPEERPFDKDSWVEKKQAERTRPHWRSAQTVTSTRASSM